MTTTPTPRLGLLLDSDDDGIDPFRLNFSRIDQGIGVQWVNDGVTPADALLYDGAVVGEITSGKIWVAKKNVGGTFDKKWIRYPWSATAFTSGFALANGWSGGGFLTWGGASVGSGGGGVNSSASDLVGTRLILPINGIYVGHITAQFTPNNIGCRGVNFNFNSTPSADDINTGVIVQSVPSAVTTCRANVCEHFPAGTSIVANLFQNTGGALACTWAIFMTLIQVVN